MAQHGDLQVPIIDAHADEEAEQPAQNPIQEEREHWRSLTDSPASRQAAGQRADRICLPHSFDDGAPAHCVWLPLSRELISWLR